MRRLAIGQKIGIGFGILIAGMLTMGVMCFILMQDVKTKIVVSRSASERSELASAAALNLRNALVAVRGAIAFGQDGMYQQTEKELVRATEIQRQLFEATPEEKKEDVQRLIEATSKWKQAILNDSLP